MIPGNLENLADLAAMKVLETIVGTVARVNSQWYAPYLVFSIAAAIGILLGRRYDRAKTFGQNLTAFLAYIFDRRVIRHPSALLDYRFAVINQLIYMLIVAYLVSAISTISVLVHDWFSGIGFLGGIGGDIGWLGIVIMALAYAFTYDTAKTLTHMMQHKVPILWEFHKVHHSAEVLTPITAIRVHPVGYLISATAVSLSFGALNGAMLAVFENDMARYSVLGLNLFAVLYFTFGLHHLKHTHVWFTYPRFIREVVASPSLHVIHHSNNPEHYDKNFGFVFTIWDRILGTYYPPQKDERDFGLGISASEGRDGYKTVAGLYLTPFRRAWRHHLKPILLRGRSEHSASSPGSRDLPAFQPEKADSLRK